MSDEQSKAITVLMGQLSNLWRDAEMHVDWAPLIAEFQLRDELSDEKVGYLIRKQYFRDWAQITDALWEFLRFAYQIVNSGRTTALMRRLCHEVVRAFPLTHEKHEYLSIKYPMVFEIGEQPLAGGMLIPLVYNPGVDNSFINESGFSGHFLGLVHEINRAHSSGCTLSTAFLSRKLLESLLISIVQRKYGTTHSDYFLTRTGRFKDFSGISAKFWGNFREDFLPFSSITDQPSLDSIRTELDKLREGFNIDVHQLGTLTDRRSLENVRDSLNRLVDFLKYLDDHLAQLAELSGRTY